MSIEPTPKAPELEAVLEGLAGRSTAINKLTCVQVPIGCGKALQDSDFAKSTGGDGVFRDELSKREYTISGFCQDCQDKIFAPDEDDFRLTTEEIVGRLS